MSLSVLATGGSVYTFNIFLVCAERKRKFLPGRRHATVSIAGNTLEESWEQQDCCEVSMKSMGPAVKL